MSDIASDFLGSDILLKDGEIILNFGDFEIVKEQDNLVASVINRLQTPLGSVFFDEEYGSRIHEFIQVGINENLLINFETEIRDTIENEDRVDEDSIEVDVEYIDNVLQAKISFTPLEEDTLLNLVLTIDKEVHIWEEEGE